MIELVVRATSRVSADSGYFGCVGEDGYKSSWAWLAPESWKPRTDDRVEVPDELALRCPADVPNDWLLQVLSYWPAWRVTEWARLEIGSGVLIVGAGGLARQVANLCRCRGALWRGIWGSRDAQNDGELWFRLSGGQQPIDILRALPRQPDSVLVLGGDAHELTTTLALCRDLGTVVVATAPAAAIDLNLYQDVHRRGLTIRASSPFKYGKVDGEAWIKAARRINRLIDSGRLVAWKP
jgi:NADPH:quinone reductase-like Zn-dependent oxidoreductase